MKKYIVILISCLSFNFVQGQRISISKGEQESAATPTNVIKEFKKLYPAYTPSWSKTGNNYRADYLDPSTNMSGMVVFDANAKIVQSETELQANSYPGSINDYHTSNLPQKKYKVYPAKDTSGTSRFYSTSNGNTYYFDRNGRFVGRKFTGDTSTTTVK